MEDFNDIDKAWKKINDDKFLSTNLKKEEIMNAISQESSLTIAELKKRLKYKMNWVLFFLFAFGIGMILNLNNLGCLAIFGLGFVIYLFAFNGIYHEYKSMDDHIDPTKDTLAEMKKQRDIIVRTLKNEHRWSVISLPILLFGALALPEISKGAILTDLLVDFNFILKLIVMIAVSIPLVSWMGKKLNNKGYGDQLNELNNHIKNMEEL